MTFFKVIKRKIGIIFLVGLLGGAAAFLVLSAQSKHYQASSDFLILQNQTTNLDYYTLSRSAEYVSKILTESMYSETFIDEVMKSGQLGSGVLPATSNARLKEWAQIIRVTRSTDLGILHVSVYANSQRDALRLAQAVGTVLSEKNSLFLGEGQSISVKIISGPIVEQNPSVKQLVLVILGGFLLGMFLTIVIVYYQSLPTEEEAYSNELPEEKPVPRPREREGDYQRNYSQETELVKGTRTARDQQYPRKSSAPANLPFAEPEDPELARLRKQIMDDEVE